MKNISNFDENMKYNDPEMADIVWHLPFNKTMFKAYGSDFFYEQNYARLSKKQQKEIKNTSEAILWLSKHPSGLQLKFKTDSLRILIEVELANKHDMCHMPATGQCGFDLYVYDNKVKDYVLHNTSIYPINQKKYRAEMSLFYLHTKQKKMRKYILNFPLYQKVKSLKIGLCKDSITLPVSYKNAGKIVIYGTSITQGGCVSRPGIMHSNILSRWLDMEVYNQGYSGSANLELIMASFISKLKNQKLLIIDAEANAGCSLIMKEHLELFLQTYFKYNPKVPVLIVSRCLFNLDLFDNKRIKLRNYYQRYILNVIDKFNNEGYKLYFLDGSKFFDGYKLNFTEFSVDGIHPTDFGNYLIAKHYYEAIINILKEKGDYDD